MLIFVVCVWCRNSINSEKAVMFVNAFSGFLSLLNAQLNCNVNIRYVTIHSRFWCRDAILSRIFTEWVEILNDQLFFYYFSNAAQYFMSNNKTKFQLKTNPKSNKKIILKNLFNTNKPSLCMCCSLTFTF